MNIAVDARHLTSTELSGVGFYTLRTLEALVIEAPQHTFHLIVSGNKRPLAHFSNLVRFPNVVIHEINLPNRLLHLLLLLPGGPTLESFVKTPLDIWWLPNLHIVRTRLPYVLTVHDMTPWMFPHFFNSHHHAFLAVTKPRTLIKNARHLLTVSEASGNDLKTLFEVPSNRFTVTPLGVDDRFSPREHPSDRSFRAAYDLNRPYFLAVATNEPRKNLASCLEAYRFYRKERGEAIPLVIAGGKGWMNRKTREALDRLPYKTDVIFLGYLPERHKPALIRGARALLFPSFYEGFGLPVAEGLACGTPVITSPVGGIPEVGKTAAIYVDPWNVNDLARALHRVSTEPPVRRAPDHLASLTWKNTAQKTLQVLESALSANSKPRP